MQHPTTQAAVAPLTARQLKSLLGEIALFSPRVSERGRRYAATGRVRWLAFDGTCVQAEVHGGDVYDTAWDWVDGNWYPECSCPVGPDCKHAYAVACCVLGQQQTLVDLDNPRLAQLRPFRLVSQTPRSARDARPRGPADDTVPHEAPLAQPPILKRLRAARDPWERQRVLGNLLRGAPFMGLAYAPGLQEALREPDPDLFCWRVARAVVQHTRGWLAPELEPYRDRPDLAARYVERIRTGLTCDLLRWADRERAVTKRSLRVVFGLERHFRSGAIVTLEARLTTTRLTDEPRTMVQLKQLRSEVHRSQGTLPPEQAALLEWITDHAEGGGMPYDSTEQRLAGTRLLSLLGRVSDASLTSLASWSPDLAPELAARCGVTPGGPVRLRSDPARLLPACVSHGDDVWVDFLFLWPDGSQRRLDDVLYIHDGSESPRSQPSFVLADGTFSLVTKEPPSFLLERFEEAGGLPLPKRDRAQLIGLLAARFPHLRDAVRPHTRLHAVTPVVALDLRDDDWLQIRLFAHSGTDGWRPGQPVPDGAVVFEYTPGDGWVRRLPDDAASGALTYHAIANVEDGAASVLTGQWENEIADDEVWLDAPEPETVEPVEAWLASMPAAAGTKGGPGGHEPPWEDRNLGWWMQASRRRMEVLAEEWERRPTGVTYFGTERVRRLLDATMRVRSRLRIVSSGIDWFAVSAEWETEGLQLSDADLAKLRAATTRFVRLRSGWVRRDVAAIHDESADVLADLGIEAGGGEQRLTMWHLAAAKPESLRALERLGADAETLRAVKELRRRVARFTGLPQVPPPPGVTAELRPYQRQGLDFLVYTTSLGIGAVLADDMGLGKTIQALAWLEWLRAQAPEGGPSLVVCPASVVHNWAREAERFVPALRVLLLTSGTGRHALRREIPKHDLVVTNYALLRRDIEAWRDIELRAAILDEAQNIKNPDAAVTHAALELKARHRLALTGTPLENRALDLWSIMSFVNPGYLGNRAQFARRFDRLDAPPHMRRLLAAKLRPVLLRRMKQEVAADLPDRIEEKRHCELTKGQRQLYLAELRRSRRLIDKLSGRPGGVQQNKIAILAALTRLRQICCHPALVEGKANFGSGKFAALAELLEPLLAEGHKVLVFSQFVRCLKLLKADLLTRDVACHMLTGQTVKRERVVTAFANDSRPCVFLISLKAGGTGLNLTSASYVVLFDPWWNPAVEAQAIDRTHRIGQDRTVIAYRMLTRGTIEEKIWELQGQKAALARDILGEEGFARSLTRDDLTYLLAET